MCSSDLRLNALKQCTSLVVNVSAALFFVFSGDVIWSAAAVMCVGALVGGFSGGRIAHRLPPKALQRVVLAIGVVVAVVYAARLITGV